MSLHMTPHILLHSLLLLEKKPFLITKTIYCRLHLSFIFQIAFCANQHKWLRFATEYLYLCQPFFQIGKRASVSNAETQQKHICLWIPNAVKNINRLQLVR